MDELTLLAAVVAAVVAHEAGHVLAARRYGFRLRRPVVDHKATFGAIGVLVVRTPARPLRRRERFWIALAGPFGSFELATVAHIHGYTQMAFWSTALGLLSLVPVKHNDGRKALDAILGKEE